MSEIKTASDLQIKVAELLAELEKNSGWRVNHIQAYWDVRVSTDNAGDKRWDVDVSITADL